MGRGPGISGTKSRGYGVWSTGRVFVLTDLSPETFLRDLRFNVLQMKSLWVLGGGGVGNEKLKDYA